MFLPVVLIISADLSKTQFLKKRLKGEFHILDRSTASLGLETAQNTNLDAILIDSKITDMSVLDLCREIRKIAAYFEAPIFIFTSNLKTNFADQALKAGATGFLNEPIDPDELGRVMIQALRTKEREKLTRSMGTQLKSPQSGSQSLTDRVSIQDVAIKEIAKAKKTATALTLLMVTPDESLSKENIQELEKLLHNNIRKNDLVVPQTRGKFILVLPKTSQRTGQIMAKTLQSEIAQTFSFTVSIGVIFFDPLLSELRSAEEEFDHLLKKVSQAVDKAKKTGNRIIMEEP
jgi:PleD family two-component response regulator